MRQMAHAPRWALVAVLALGLAGCAKKKSVVDADFTLPEGAASPAARLVLWRETPTTMRVYQDVLPLGVGPEDRLLSVIPFGSDRPGRIHGLIFDSTAASGYQIMRKDANGGLSQLNDFVAVPTRRWLDREWEFYAFADDDTARLSRTYIGRGVVGGVVSAGSPLTNAVRDTSRAYPTITYTGNTGIANDGTPVPLDSLFLMEWNSVPGASGYYLHVYQPAFNLVTTREQVMSGMQAPLFVGKSRDILVAFVPAASPQPATVSFRMPTASATVPGARIITVRPTGYGQEYRVRIAAVDKLGRMISVTTGDNGIPLSGTLPDGTALTTTQYALYSFGAVRITPSRLRP